MRFRNYVLAWCTVGLFLADAIAVFGLWSYNTHAEQLIEHTHVVLEDLTSLANSLQGGESGVRGYLGTGERNFLISYYASNVRVPEIIQSLAAVFASNRVNQIRLRQLRDLIDQKLEFERQLISCYEQSGEKKAIALERTERGAQLMRSIDEQIQNLQRDQSELLYSYHREFFRMRNLLLIGIAILSMLGVICLVRSIQLELQSFQLERQKEVALKELEGLNRDLNEQIADLLQTREDLGKAIKARAEFLANVSHELRTPLAGVIGATEMVLTTSLLEEQRNLIITAKDCGESLLALVNDILDFAKIEAHELRLKPAVFDLSISMQAALESLSMKAQMKGLKFGVSMADDLPKRVLGDVSRLRQVLVNLVDNAVKFTDSGTVSVEVFVAAQSAKTVNICFAVSDTGIGIKSGDLAVIFNRFFQLDATSTRRHGGTGLGLAISNSLVELMNGRIEVESNPGLGSRFSFTIPFEKLGEDNFSVPEKQANVAVLPDASKTSACVLIVDDSDIIRNVTSAQLKKLGYRVEVAANGRQAVELAENRAYSLIIMDLQMPILDGLAATSEIRSSAHGRCSNVAILAMTAHAMPGDRERCLEAGMNDYMPKPVSLANLKEMLSKWLPSDELSGVSVGAIDRFRHQQV
jgi:signal transduction histidine kinase/CheY-like chemotaxis protein